MLPDRVSNPGPLTYKSGALPIALRGPAESAEEERKVYGLDSKPGTSWSPVRCTTDCAMRPGLCLVRWQNDTSVMSL